MDLKLILRKAGPYHLVSTPERGWAGASTGLYYHTGSQPWYGTPLPFPWHRCHIHSLGVNGPGWGRKAILRCRCGSFRYLHLVQGWDPGCDLVGMASRWQDRNSRLYGTYSLQTTW